MQKEDKVMVDRGYRAVLGIRWVTSWVAVLAFVLLVGTEALAQSEPAKVTTILPVKNLVLAPIFVALDNGNFKKQNLVMEVAVVSGGVPANAALVAGQAEFLGTAADEFLKTTGPAGKTLAVYTFTNAMTMSLQFREQFLRERNARRDLPVKERVRRLKGATLGTITLGGAPDVYARWLYGYAGLDPRKDLQMLRIGGPAALIAALKAGQIDGFLMSPPTGQIVEAQGTGRMIVIHDEVPPFADNLYEMLLVRKDYPQKNRVIVERVVKAIGEGQQFLYDDPERAAALLNSGSFKDTALPLLVKSLTLMRSAFKPQRMTKERWDASVKLMREAGWEIPFDVKENVHWTGEFGG